MREFVRALPLGAMMILALAVRPALADQPDNPIWNAASIDIGAYAFGTSTTLRLDGTTARGTTFDVEHALDYHKRDVLRIDAYWRFTPRQKLRVMYFNANRSSSASLDEPLQFGNVTFPLNAQVHSSFNNQLIAVAYEFDFIHRENWELGAALGVHDMKVSLDLSAQALNGSAVYANQASANGPLPVLGLAGAWRLGPRLYINASAQYLSASIKPYSGSLSDFGASLTWQPLRHFGIGAGYDTFIVHANVNSSAFSGSLRWRYEGPRIFVAGTL